MTDLKLIQGAGGGGGGGGGAQQRTPTEAADSLQSVQYASVLDLLSEGEVEGLDDGLKSIYLDGTPIVGPGGSSNFTGYYVDSRVGTQAQSYIPTTDGIESETGVNVAVTTSSPTVRTITDSDVNRVRVTVQLPSLQIIKDNGDIVGHSVRIQLQVQYNGGGYTTIVDDTISGKTTNSYQRDYILSLTGAFPVDIRMVRVSADESSARRQNRTFWFSYTEIIDAKLRYPNSALAFLRFDSRQFNNIPARKYLIRGIKVQVPNNAAVDTTTHLGRVTYSGLWNGTLGAATWCADPAWCLYDLLTNTRYGAGIPASSLDKFDFYAISQYCNELVPNGFGGVEPRFQCHLLLNSREEIYNTIQEFVALFRGIAYYGAGSMVVLQDKPSDAQYLLGPSNVVGGNFSYSGSSQKTRHTTATVAYQSYDTLGEVEFEYVEDQEAIAKFGIINKEIKAMGCYSRGQAHRLGKWLLLSEQNLTETVTFAVGIDSGIILRPGMVIDIADPVKAGSRRSGRIAAATTTTITIDDAALTFNLSLAPTISVLLPTGLVETRSIASRNGVTITVASAFSEAPNPQAVWLIETNDIQANQFRVISVAEGDDGTYGITALSYNSSIYAAIESDLKLEFRDISNLSALPDPPSDIVATEHLYQDGSSILTAVELSWIAPSQRISGYRVSYRLDDDNWISFDTANPSARITGLREGTLYVQVYSLNTIGGLSRAATAQFTLFGKLTPPGDVQNLSIEPISYNSARLRWDATVDLDVKVAGRVHIRHSAKTDGTGTWSNSIDLIPAIAGYNTEAIVPLIEGEILVKFEDDGGRQSVNETSVIVDFPDAIAPLPVLSRREDTDSPPFQGDKEGTFYDSGDNVLKLDFNQSFDDVPDVDAMISFDAAGDVVSSGTYDFLNLLDLEGVFALDLSRYFITRGDYPSDNIDSRTNTVDLWSDWDGIIADKVNARLLVSHTNNNYSGTYSQSGTTVTVSVTGHGYTATQEVTVEFTSGTAVSGTFTIATAATDSFTYTAASSLTTSGNVKLISGGPWTPLQDFVSGTYRGRAFRFQALLETQVPDQQILVDELGYDATFQRRTEHSDGAVASTAATKSITFAHPFWTGTALLGGTNAYLPSIGITAQNMATGDYFVVTNVTGTGFDVTFKNSGGTDIDRNFNWSATGYGRGS